MPLALLAMSLIGVSVGWAALSLIAHIFIGASSSVIDLFGNFGTSVVISIIFLVFSLRNIKIQSILLSSVFSTNITKIKKISTTILISFILLSIFFKVVNMNKLSRNIGSYYESSNHQLKEKSVFK